jgi:hypothetical protein
LPAIFEFLYREYCRARLVEMRKQLFLTNSPETPEADGKVGRSDGANDRDSGLDDSQVRRRPSQAKLNGLREPPAAV